MWPQWCSVVDVSQQGLHLSKKISKIEIFFENVLKGPFWLLWAPLNLERGTEREIDNLSLSAPYPSNFKPKRRLVDRSVREKTKKIYSETLFFRSTLLHKKPLRPKNENKSIPFTYLCFLQNHHKFKLFGFCTKLN